MRFIYPWYGCKVFPPEADAAGEKNFTDKMRDKSIKY